MVQGVTLAQLDAGLLTLKARLAARKTAESPRSLTAGDVRERARAYLANIPGAVSGVFVDGLKGHDRTFYVANRLVRGFGLSPDDAYPLFHEWSLKSPPDDRWSEHDLRRKLEEAARQPGPRGFLLGEAATRVRIAGDGTSHPRRLRNFTVEEVPSGETVRQVQRGRPLPAIATDLEDLTCGWPKRVGDQLFVLGADGEPLFLKTTEGLFAWIGSALAPADRTEGDPVEWSGRVGVSKSEFRAYLEQNAEHYEAVELSPHEPPLPGVYYVPRPTAGGDGKALAELLTFFRPSTAEDGDLIQAYLMTLLWGGPAGQRPAWLFTNEEGDDGRGIGKSKVVEYLAHLVGGSLLVLQCEKFTDVVTRILSPEASGRRVVLLDNVKATRFSWGELEGFITTAIVSGKRLYNGEGRRPNHFSVCLTGNNLAVSSDVAKRVLVVKLRRPDYGPGWDTDIVRFVKERRWEIVGDLVAAIRAPTKPVTVRSRWGPWQDEVLARLPDPDAVQKVIDQRSRAADDDRDEAASITEAAAQLVRDRLGEDPDTAVVLIDVKVLADKVGPLLGKERAGTNNISRAIGLHAIPNLSRADRPKRRMWKWTGDKAEPCKLPLFVITERELLKWDTDTGR